MIRWRDNLLNGRWRIVQDSDDYWRVHDTTTSTTLPGLHLTRRDARQAAELHYLHLTYRWDLTTLSSFTHREENWR